MPSRRRYTNPGVEGTTYHAVDQQASSSRSSNTQVPSNKSYEAMAARRSDTQPLTCCDVPILYRRVPHLDFQQPTTLPEILVVGKGGRRGHVHSGSDELRGLIKRQVRLSGSVGKTMQPRSSRPRRDGRPPCLLPPRLTPVLGRGLRQVLIPKA